MNAGASDRGNAINHILMDRIAAAAPLEAAYTWVCQQRQEMARLRVMPHPDKTALGRTTKGFDFLGYWVTPGGLRVAARTVGRMVEKVSRLYEQGATASRLDRYLHHWGQWVRAGLGDRLVPGPVVAGFGLTYLEPMG